jgi:signal transduction histidine kinase
LQDSGPTDSRFFSHFLQPGVLVADARGGLRFASASACQLFGVADESALRARFPDIAAHLRLYGSEASSGPQYGRADVPTDAGVRAIRFEMHTVHDKGTPLRVVFVRDRTRPLPGDRALLLASEALANRHVLTGLVHSAKGPLNNFSLTLALMEAGLGRARESGPTPELLARFERYVEVLHNESTRLAGVVDSIHALTLSSRGDRDAIDLCAIARDCAAVLRHAATMREVALELDAPEPAILGTGAPDLVRLAVLCAAITVIDLTAAQGRVTLRVAREDAGNAGLRVLTTQPALPSALVSGVFGLSCTTDSEFSPAVAARLVVEAQDGGLTLADDDEPGFVLQIPLASARIAAQSPSVGGRTST